MEETQSSNKPPPEEEIQPSQLILKIPHHKTIDGRLPTDSLIHVWARLPLKSIYKFRTICHLWNTTIISDPLLPNLRHSLQTTEPPPTLLLTLTHLNSEPVKVPDRPARISIQPFEQIIRTNFLTTSHTDPKTYPIKNGFTPYVDYSLQLLPSQGPLTCFASNAHFYLCNPSINQFLRVPPSVSHSTCHGSIGYFRVENRYVLVNLIGTKVDILEFSSSQISSAKWRGIDIQSPASVRGFGLMVNGLFFWASAQGPSFAICLDYKKEEFSVISPPQGNPNETMLYDQMYLVGFKGAVCAVDNFSRPPRMEIWVLQHGNEEGKLEFSWVRKYNIYMVGMSRDLVYPFCEYDGGNGEEMVLCNGTRSRLYCYNLKSRILKQVYRPKNRSFEQLGLYTPGLFPLN